MEQVRAILVDLRAGLLIHIRVGVAADVVTDIDDVHAGTRMLHRLLRHRQAEQARTNDDEIGILGGFRIIRRTGHRTTFQKSCSFSEKPCY